MVVIFLNSLALGLVSNNLTSGFENFADKLEIIFLAFFALESLIKIAAMHKDYFYDKWNIYDLLIVLGGVAEQFLKMESLSGIAVLRILRICRIFKLLKKAKRLNAIFNSLVNTIPTFINVFALIIIMIFFYSVIGNRVFAFIKFSG
jgi:hypothetical protein